MPGTLTMKGTAATGNTRKAMRIPSTMAPPGYPPPPTSAYGRNPMTVKDPYAGQPPSPYQQAVAGNTGFVPNQPPTKPLGYPPQQAPQPGQPQPGAQGSSPTPALPYRPYQPPVQSNRLDTPQEMQQAGYQAGARRTEVLAPGLAPYIPSAKGGKFGKKDLKTIEVGINLENRDRALQDRESAYEQYAAALNQIGQSPEQALARQVATERLQNTELLTPQELMVQEEAIRQRAARGYETGRKTAEEDAAARGIGGLSSYEQAALQHDYQRQSSDELQQLLTALAQGRETKQQTALQTLSGMTADEEARRLAIQDAIAKLYGETEYAPIDLSGLSRKKG